MKTTMKTTVQAVTQAELNALVSTRSLEPGEVYIVDGQIRRATSTSAHQVVGGGARPLRHRGLLISDTAGGAGETVAVASTPTNGTWAVSAVDRFPATRRIVIPDANTGGTIQFTRPTSSPYCRFTADSSIVVALYIEACNSSDQLIVTVSNDAVAPTGMTNGASATLGLNANKAPGYWFAAIDANQLSGSVTLPTMLNGVRVRVARQSGGSETRVHVCGVYVNARSKPTVLIDFDDAFLSQYTDYFPIMQNYGLVGSVSVPYMTVGQSAGGLDTFNYADLRQLREMRDAGFAMLVHGYYPHNSAPLNSYATILADVQANQAFVRDNLDPRGARHYVLIAGQQHPDTDRVMRETGMLTCRGTIGEQTVELPDGPDNLYRLFSTPISASAGLADMQLKFDRARQNGWTIRYTGHRVVDTVTDNQNEITRADWEAFCAYIAPHVASGAVDNLTVPDWYDQRFA